MKATANNSMLTFNGEEYLSLICKHIIEMLYVDMYRFRNRNEGEVRTEKNIVGDS